MSRIVWGGGATPSPRATPSVLVIEKGVALKAADVVVIALAK